MFTKNYIANITIKIIQESPPDNVAQSVSDTMSHFLFLASNFPRY